MIGGNQENLVRGESDQHMQSMIPGIMEQVVVGAIEGGENNITIGQSFFSSPDHSYVEGNNLMTDLILTLDHQLIFEDMESISSRTATPSTIASLQAPLMKFMVEKVLKGAELSQENIVIALVDIADDWVSQMVSRSIKSEPPPQSLLSRSSPLVWSQSKTRSQSLTRRLCTTSCLPVHWSWRC